MSEKEKKETPKTTSKKTVKKETNPIAKPYCYIGPNIPAGALKQNSILVGTKEEIRKRFKDEIEEYPQIEKLIVPVEKLSEAKSKVNEAGNIINKHYQDMISSINAANKKEV